MRAAPDPLLEELRAQGPQMIRVATVICTLAFAVMWGVDPHLASGDDLFAARVVRVAACSALMALCGLSFVGDLGVRFGRAATLTAALITGSAVVFLAYFTGGGDSDYHEALYVAIFGYAVLPAAWRRYDALLVFVGYLVLYDVVLMAGDRVGQVGVFLTHNALIGAAVVAAVVLRRIIMEVRRRDIERRAELASANERLTALDEAKSRFFANLSHELRTPLTLTLAPLETMIDSARDPLTPGQREKLQLAQRNALRLLRLVDDLLALSRAEAASLRLQTEPLDVGEMLRTMARDIAELAARKQIALAVDVAEGTGRVEADAQLVERVLLNLVGNATKFVKEGGHIRLGARPVQGGVELTVTDDGIGIASKDLPYVFTRFYQADSGSTRHFGGTGIGLALSREIIELHGGRLTAESVQGEGTTLRAFLPRTLPPERAALAVRASSVYASSAESGLPEWHQAIRTAASYRYQGIEDATERRIAPRPRPKGHAPSVLVVEDNPDMIRFLVALLANEFHVISAQNGALGLKLALERQPDLIISDVMMPEMDGFEMARHLRESPLTRQIPLIFLTARGSPEDRLMGHHEGADTYLPKPFRGEELLAAVDALLSRQRTVRDAAVSRQDEAVVYMASGIADAIAHASTTLASVEGGSAALQAALAELREVRDALVHLARAGSASLVAPAAVLAAVREAVSRVGAKGAEVELRVPEGLLVAIQHEELVGVIQALLVRALAITPAGRTVSVLASQHGTDRVTVSVSDEGPGLLPDQIDRLFFPFQEHLGPVARPAEGVAMAYAFRVVRARGGTVGVETEEGLGTTLVLGFPILGRGGAS